MAKWELLMGFLMLFLILCINLHVNEKKLPLQEVLGGGDTAVSVNWKTSAKEEEITETEQTAAQKTSPDTGKTADFCVVLDAGHGSSDPGKIGCNDVKEKDINLAIVQKLKKFLEEEKVKVVLTRDSDAPLYDASAVNKKMSDMNKRVSVIESVSPDLVVSIHQNSYHDSSVCGPQVFYYKTSENGKKAAEILQASFDGLEEVENRRAAKANDNYYLLLHTSAPMVIAECGFLSNPGEAALLVQDSYQEKVAWVLHLGILQYRAAIEK